MAEGFEAIEAVIRAHAACADTAEGEVVDGDVENDIIDGDAAGGCALEDVIAFFGVVAEEVEREGAGALVDVGDGVVDAFVGEDGEDGAEDLLLHDKHLVGGIEDEVERHLLGFLLGEIFFGGVDLDDTGSFVACIVEIALEALVVARVDNGGVIGIVEHRWVHGAGVFLAQLDGGFDAFGGDEEVIWGEADLTRVEELTCEDAQEALREVGVTAEDDGGFAAQFEGDGDEVVGCGAHDVTTDSGGACEDQVVEGKAAEGGGGLSVACKDGDLAWCEGFAKHLLEQIGGGRG